MGESQFVMRFPELREHLRVRPIEHNQAAFQWFVGNLPTRALAGHTVVAGFSLFIINIPVRNPFPWRERDLVVEDISKMPDGRFTFFMTAGKVANVSCKCGEVTEPMSYITWAEVIEEDKPALYRVGSAIWKIFMGNQKDIVHVEFVPLSGTFRKAEG
jgi:hypothetical protein